MLLETENRALSDGDVADEIPDHIFQEREWMCEDAVLLTFLVVRQWDDRGWFNEISEMHAFCT